MMTQEFFQDAMFHIREVSLDTLNEKNARYSISRDPVRNFTLGASFINGTDAQAAWGYMAKHLAALADIVQFDRIEDLDDIEEKCKDIINYTAFIYVMMASRHFQSEKSKTENVKRNDYAV